MLKKLIALQLLTLSLSGACGAMEGENGDKSYIQAQSLFNHNMGAGEPVRLEYFEALEEAAKAGSKMAKKNLQRNSRVIRSNNCEWGGSPEANVAIRAIFARWVPKGEEMYIQAQSLFNHNMGAGEPVRLEYFEALEKAALADSKKAKKSLRNYASHKGTMADEVVWGGSPEANVAIRAIFARWVPQEK